MTVACVLIDHFPIKVELQRNRALAGRPIVLAKSDDPRTPIVDFSPEAGLLVAGMPLRDALSQCSDANLLEPDLPYYQQVFDGILEALEQRSPVVEDAGLGCSYVDTRGLSGLYEGEAGIARALLRAVPGHLQPKVGMAGGKFTAYVAATKALPVQAMLIAENTRQFLAQFSVDILPVSWKMATALHEFGLHTLGQVAALPLPPFQTQFGKAGQTMWQLARGIDYRPVVARVSEETITKHLSFPDPTVSLGAVLLGIESLISAAFSGPQRQDCHVRGLTIEAQLLQGAPWVKRVSFREPVANGARAYSIVKETAMSNLSLPSPVEEIKLTLWGLTAEAGMQSNLFAEIRKRNNLRNSLRQLEARLGKRVPVYQVREVEPWSRIPERRRALVPLSL